MRPKKDVMKVERENDDSGGASLVRRCIVRSCMASALLRAAADIDGACIKKVVTFFLLFVIKMGRIIFVILQRDERVKVE